LNAPNKPPTNDGDQVDDDAKVFVAKEGYDPDEERDEHGRWTAAGGGVTGGAMANMSEHQREAERAHAALTSGQGIVETPRFKEMVVAAIAKLPSQRSGAEPLD